MLLSGGALWRKISMNGGALFLRSRFSVLVLTVLLLAVLITLFRVEIAAKLFLQIKRCYSIVVRYMGFDLTYCYTLTVLAFVLRVAPI